MGLASPRLCRRSNGRWPRVLVAALLVEDRFGKKSSDGVCLAATLFDDFGASA
jgi:hypothetical protein